MIDTEAIVWEHDYALATRRVRDERRQLLVFFHKLQCVGCGMLESVSFRDPAVRGYLDAHFVPFQATMSVREHAQLFRDNHVIWTPSVGVADHRGQMHYLSPGFLPPDDLLAALRIGRARSLIAWTRYAEAAQELEAAAAPGGAMAPEALFWLASAYYLWQRGDTTMHEVWARLRGLYPASPWARRTYPPA